MSQGVENRGLLIKSLPLIARWSILESSVRTYAWNLTAINRPVLGEHSQQLTDCFLHAPLLSAKPKGAVSKRMVFEMASLFLS